MVRQSDKLSPVWTRGLSAWYRRCGRHELPWRHTREPWPVLLSEVMLQQTQVARVLPYWRRFVERWPTPGSFASASPEAILREWQGLGYPRRALALHRTAAIVASGGWPADETGLTALPGVGRYTARALLVLSAGAPGPVPADINVSRLTARAAMGAEPGEVSPSAIDVAIAAGRPPRLSPRDYTYSLFDAGAIHCRSKPRCSGCPLQASCPSALRLASGVRPSSRLRQPGYAGSIRELRGALLRESLAAPSADDAELRRRVAHLPQATAAATSAALDGLRADGLLLRTAGGHRG